MTFVSFDIISDVPTTRTHIQTANGECISVTKTGSINISPAIHEKFVPSSLAYLINFYLLVNWLKSLIALFLCILLSSADCVVQVAQTGTIIRRGTEKRGIYYVDKAVQKGHTSFAHGSPNHQLWMWHWCLGHP